MKLEIVGDRVKENHMDALVLLHLLLIQQNIWQIYTGAKNLNTFDIACMKHSYQKALIFLFILKLKATKNTK